MKINPFNTTYINLFYQYREDADNLMGFEFKEEEYVINRDGIITKK
jgi:hypothetical protein